MDYNIVVVLCFVSTFMTVMYVVNIDAVYMHSVQWVFRRWILIIAEAYLTDRFSTFPALVLRVV